MKPKKNCTHCGSSSTLPIQYGLISDQVHQENTKDRKWVWGGCVIYKGGDTDYCNDCNNTFGGIKAPHERVKSKEPDLELFLRDREKLLDTLDKYLDGEKDEEMYAQALKEAEGDKVEAEHIYFSLFMQSERDND